jgi:hypothetical protein
VTGAWRRLHKEELHELYSSRIITLVTKSRQMRRVGKMRERDQLKIRHRWEDNIKIDFQEVEWGEAWIGLIWLRTGTGGRLL